MKYLSKICSFCTTHRYPSPVSLIAISHHASQSFSRYNYHDNSFYSWSAHDLSSVSITGGSHRYLSSVPPYLSSVSLICIAELTVQNLPALIDGALHRRKASNRYLSTVSLIGISHHVTHLNYVWRICCQVNHFRNIIITITHFLLKVRMWSICKNMFFLYHSPVSITGIYHRYLSPCHTFQLCLTYMLPSQSFSRYSYHDNSFSS